MKDLKLYLLENFTWDDEMVARYRYILKSKFPQEEMDANEIDIEMWDSLGINGKEQAIQKFEGFINDNIYDGDHTDPNRGNLLQICRPTTKKEMFDYLADEISNHLDSIFGTTKWNSNPDGYYMVTIQYDDEMIRIQDYDWENSKHIYPKKKWNQQIDRNPNWIINESLGTYWAKSDAYLKDIVKYTGWHFYKNGKMKI